MGDLNFIPLLIVYSRVVLLKSMDSRICLVCSKALLGRSDKKYCSDNCRFEASHQRRKISLECITLINAQLLKNRNILKMLCPSGRTMVDRQLLIELGFQPATFTSLYVTSKNSTYYICYDFAFVPLIRDNVPKAMIVSAWKNLPILDPWKHL